MSINTDDLTLGQIKEISNLVGLGGNKQSSPHPYKIGEKCLIRTVTHILVGKLEFVGDQELTLGNASWIADTGRFNDALVDGFESLEGSEIEPFSGSAIVGRGALIDCCHYPHPLPTKQK